MFKHRFFPFEDEAPGGGGEGGGGGGGYTPLAGDDFVKILPPEFKGHTALAPIKDIGSLVKSFVNAQSMVGADKLVLPKPDAPDAAWGDVYKKLGRPETADKYTFKPEGLPEDFPFGEEDDKFMRQLAHEVGMTEKQFGTFMKKYLAKGAESFNRMNQEQTEQAKAHVESLRQKYGNQTDSKIAAARDTVSRVGGEPLKQFLDETGMGDHPVMIDLFVTLGDLIANDQMIRDRFVNSGFVSNNDEAKQQISSLQMNADFMKMYTNRDDPGHDEAVKKMERLYAVAYPGKQTTG